MDEHRLGLKPILRTAWAPTGQPLVCPVHPRYEWLYIYAFVHPETGESRFWIVPTLDKQADQLVIESFAKTMNIRAGLAKLRQQRKSVLIGVCSRREREGEEQRCRAWSWQTGVFPVC